MKVLNLVTLLLIIIGGVNWLLVGAFQFDLVAAIFGGQDAAIARVVYGRVGMPPMPRLCRSSAPCLQAKSGPSAANS